MRRHLAVYDVPGGSAARCSAPPACRNRAEVERHHGEAVAGHVEGRLDRAPGGDGTTDVAHGRGGRRRRRIRQSLFAAHEQDGGQGYAKYGRPHAVDKLHPPRRRSSCAIRASILDHSGLYPPALDPLPFRITTVYPARRPPDQGGDSHHAPRCGGSRSCPSTPPLPPPDPATRTAQGCGGLHPHPPAPAGTDRGVGVGAGGPYGTSRECSLPILRSLGQWMRSRLRPWAASRLPLRAHSYALSVSLPPAVSSDHAVCVGGGRALRRYPQRVRVMEW